MNLKPVFIDVETFSRHDIRRLTEDYKHYGDRELIATSQVVGLATLGRELRAIEDKDPEGVRYPRMKKSDDATALLVKIEG